MESSSHNAESETHQFILFVSGMADKSGHAVENINRICDKHLAGKFELQIIDINRDKQTAVDYQIIGIPTLIKLFPNPKRMIIGDLSDTQKVLRILDIEV